MRPVQRRSEELAQGVELGEYHAQLIDVGMDEAALFWGWFSGKTLRGVKYAFPEPTVAGHDPDFQKRNMYVRLLKVYAKYHADAAEQFEAASEPEPELEPETRPETQRGARASPLKPRRFCPRAQRMLEAEDNDAFNLRIRRNPCRVLYMA